MAFCTNCGNELPAEAKICPKCGMATAPAAQQTLSTDEAAATQQTPPTAEATAAPTTDYTAQFDPQDIADNKLMAILCYLGWLFLIPMLASPAKDSPYVRFHLNQGLIVFLASLLSSVLMFICIGFITGIFCVVCQIIGIVNVCQGKAKELPLIGKLRILK